MTDDGFILWAQTPEKPFPITLDDYIHVKFADGSDDTGTEPWTVRDWHEFRGFEQKGHGKDIMAYKKAYVN